ncbi:cold-shock protein (plasmid) [Rhodococcus pseudokoreensis]|uniref:Cold-shock protein n=1 Tax=Rhodococcus pseudokoreensis TaxID=2811421 RepID=A0A974ZRJ0_9NOCA|nr:cold-shock protein [Rhodococcus pseudokoreensis]
MKWFNGEKRFGFIKPDDGGADLFVHWTPSLVVGSVDVDHLAIVVHSRSHPEATDYWDGNWVRSILRVRAGGFTAHVNSGAAHRRDPQIR